MPRSPAPLDPEKYEQDEDGMLREIVGPWAREKHERVKRYSKISGAVRKKWYKRGRAGATYIELYCGTGRVRIDDTGEVAYGSPLVAWHESVADCSAFTQIHIADADQRLVHAAEHRLKATRAPVYVEVGTAAQTVDRVIAKLNKYALHFVFLDPYNLGSLPFEVIRKLATLERMDILIHVSVQDLNRNLRRYLGKKDSPLERFAPDWQVGLDVRRPDQYLRWKFMEHWRSLIKGEGMRTTEVAELVTAERKQPLYWLAFAARHDRALEFWEKIRNIEEMSQPSLI